MKRNRRNEVPNVSRTQRDGEWLRRVRRRLMMTQGSFAAELGISVKTLSNYERGESRVSLQAMQRAEELERKFARSPELANDHSPSTPSHTTAPTRRDEPTDEHPRTLFGRLGAFAEQSWTTREEYYSKTRKRADTTIYSLFMFAATVFLVEQVQRMGPEPADYSLFDDILFIGSFIACLMLIIPLIMSTAWGIKSGSSRSSKTDGKGNNNGTSDGDGAND